MNCSTETTRVRSFDQRGKLFAERIVCCRCGSSERIEVPEEETISLSKEAFGG